MIGDETAMMIADIGSGSGFPGIIIKILLPQTIVYLIDSSRKKYLFLLELCEKIDIPCKVINARIEDLPRDVQIHFNLVVGAKCTPWQHSGPGRKNLCLPGSLY
jgi:16S rRNA (guanine527-N7)-methyltransferase